MARDYPSKLRAGRYHPEWMVTPFVLLFLLVVFTNGYRAIIDTREKVEARRKEVRVAVAANFQFAFEEMAAAFREEYPEFEVSPTYGSSGNFYAQLSQDAPFDLFLSADTHYPRQLVEQGFAKNEDTFLYAVGQIVLWVPNRSELDLERLGIEAVNDSSVKKIAIANPTLAPYGQAAEAALKKLGVYEAVKDRLVFGDNIAQTAHFVESGAADLGILALSLAVAEPMKERGRYWVVPLDTYPPIEQSGVILQAAKSEKATLALRSFLTGPQGRGILKRYGYTLPEE
ncbi:ABC-type molybdate transport system periplasmic component [Planctomycetales bacterium 10988]|nr:ABC-type molybdate transport system periplasmic component [Planctomycetales bacterium 10988]